MNQTKADRFGGLPSAKATTRPLDQIISFEQLSLADDVRAPSWRDPVRRLQRQATAAPPQMVPLDDPARMAATLATLHLIEARATKSDPWELRRAIHDLEQVRPFLRADDEREYAHCLAIKLQALLEAQLVRDVESQGPRPAGDLH